MPPLLLVYDTVYTAGVERVAEALRTGQGRNGRGGDDGGEGVVVYLGRPPAERQKVQRGGGGGGGGGGSGGCGRSFEDATTSAGEGEVWEEVSCESSSSSSFVLVGGLEVRIPCEEATSGGGEEAGEEARREAALCRAVVCFIGSDGWQLSSVLLRCNGCRKCLVYDPAEDPDKPPAATTAPEEDSPSAVDA